MNKPIRLSICVVTYNHEKYIAHALDSFLMQETNFAFQVIVGDDCSTDNTTNIIKEYALKYPDIIKPILREKNIGAMNNSLDVYSSAKTEYVAICDGDDYWTDKTKLQRQVDFLDKNPKFSICFHRVKVVYEDNSKPSYIYPKYSYFKMLLKKNIKFLLKENFMQTNSIVYRWRFVDSNVREVIPNNICPGDWFLSLLHAQIGKIGFINRCMSVYNRNSGGIFTSSQSDEIDLKYGIENFNFYYLVYKTIAKGDKKYYNKSVLRYLFRILIVYLKNKQFEKIELLRNAFSQEFEKSLEICIKRSKKLFKN
jgi:glycosyltransferase involved in cell wall biosynthesis